MCDSQGCCPTAVGAIPLQDAFVLRGVLTRDECLQWIAGAEAARFLKHGQVGPDGTVAAFAGNRQRATMTSAEKAERLWQQLRPHVEPRRHRAKEFNYSFLGPAAHSIPSGMYEPVGVADLMRVSKYEPGGRFSPHCDTTYARDTDYVGLMTVLVYLNDDFEGGETTIVDAEGEEQLVRPEAGMAFVFYHHQQHSGRAVQKGSKIVARTEIMYGLQADWRMHAQAWLFG